MNAPRLRCGVPYPEECQGVLGIVRRPAGPAPRSSSPFRYRSAVWRAGAVELSTGDWTPPKGRLDAGRFYLKPVFNG